MPISEKVRMSMVTGSFIRKMFEEGIALKKRYGKDKVFDLTIGNPTMEPPEKFNLELKKLVENPFPGMHRYMENKGFSDTCAAVATRLKLETGIDFKADEIIMTCGTAGALNAVLKALLNPGEEVITFAPFFFEYAVFVDNHGGIIKVLPSDETFIPDFTALEQGITANTKAIIINSPNNPTGIVYEDEVLRKIAAILTKKSARLNKRIYIISDDVYCNIYYNGPKCPRIANYYPHTIIVSSYSKNLALPGERIGYAAVNPDCENAREVTDGIIYGNRVLGFVNAPALMQLVIRNLQNVSVPVAEYQNKRDFLYDNLTKMGYQVIKPQGAFYLFPKSPVKDDLAFANELKELRVLVVPGSAFKKPGHFRIAYCQDNQVFEGSLEGLREIIRKYST